MQVSYNIYCTSFTSLSHTAVVISDTQETVYVRFVDFQSCHSPEMGAGLYLSTVHFAQIIQTAWYDCSSLITGQTFITLQTPLNIDCFQASQCAKTAINDKHSSGFYSAGSTARMNAKHLNSSKCTIGFQYCLGLVEIPADIRFANFRDGTANDTGGIGCFDRQIAIKYINIVHTSARDGVLVYGRRSNLTVTNLTLIECSVGAGQTMISHYKPDGVTGTITLMGCAADVAIADYPAVIQSDDLVPHPIDFRCFTVPFSDKPRQFWMSFKRISLLLRASFVIYSCI